MKTLLLLPGICLFAFNTHAQNFSLTKDINTSKDGNPANSINNLYFGYKDNIFFDTYSPYNGSFATLNGVAYFTADDGVHGTELWRSNNTSAGTYMVKDITPGTGSSNIQNITATNNKLFFTVNQIVYSSDGTDAGTMPVPGITYNGDVTTCLTPAGNTLYFLTAVSRLWKTDGTQAGTSLIIDFRAVYNYSTDWLGQLTYVNGALFFTPGYDNAYGPELWKSDGTAAGTMMVKDINPGSGGSLPSNLTSVNGKLYFSADDGNKISLWVSDGTFSGTKPVVNNNGVSLTQMKYRPYQYLDVTPFPVINKVLYFNGFTANKGNELYKYNLNKPAEGITLVKDIVQGTLNSAPSNLTAVDSTLYFSVSDATNQQQLWKSNGTTAGTVLVKNMGAGSSNYFSNFAASNGLLLFSYYKASSGTELWSSNGTLAGTLVVKDIYTGNHSSSPAYFTYIGNNISLFSANNGTKGIELWHTDGTSAGTGIIKDINNTTTANSNPGTYTAVTLNNKYYFSATDNDGNNLYVSNGTSGGTNRIKGVNQGLSLNPTVLTIFKNAVYFASDSGGYKSIYKTDGTDAGTIQLFSPGKTNLSVSMFAAQNYLYVFFHEIDSSYSELWVLNSASGSWQKVQNVYGSVGVGTTLINTLFFTGTDTAHGAELWTATYNPGSAQLLKDIYPGPTSSYPSAFVIYNNKLYFRVYDSSNTSYIYSSDGTKQGTKRLHAGSDPIAQAGGKLYFNSSNASVGTELFVSDGTTNGTKLLKDIYQGLGSSNPGFFTAVDSILYFSAYDVNNGYELWKTNGTKKGTVLVKDIWPGTYSSTPQRLTSADGKLYFMAYIDNTYKLTLFVSDGTNAGTKQVVDAGLNGVTVNDIKGGGDKLYINGYTYALGNELYAGSSPDFAFAANNSAARRIANNTLSATILGNPVQNELNLAVNNIKTQQAYIMITDASGKILVNNKQLLNKGSNTISYTTNTWPSGVYTLNIVAEDGSMIQLKALK
jgi:ELWxxDGT repeat protein